MMPSPMEMVNDAFGVRDEAKTCARRRKMNLARKTVKARKAAKKARRRNRA